MSLADLHQLIDEWYAKEQQDKQPAVEGEVTITTEVPRKLPEGKRVVRTRSSGDKVYLIDDNAKTRQWVTNPEALKAQGFELTDVAEIEDSELIKYNMAATLYK